MKSIYKMLWEYKYMAPYGTENFIDIKNIKVPWYYLKTTPRVEKVKKYYTYLNKHGFIDKPITIKKKTDSINILHDEYCRYLIMANEIDEYKKLHNIDTYEKIPEELRMVPVRYEKQI